MRRFASQHRDFKQRFLTAIETDDAEGATRLAHALKGLAGTIGAEQVQTSAAALESACAEHQSGEIDLWLNETLAALTPVLNGLERLKPAARSNSGTRTLDLTALDPLVMELRALLQGSDADALRLIETIEPLLSGTPWSDQLRPIADAIEGYDFDAAFTALSELDKHIRD